MRPAHPRLTKPRLVSSWVMVRSTLLAAACLLAACGQLKEASALLAKPKAPFEATPAPPAPDYARSVAWLAFPGRNGLERSTPPGMTAVDEAIAPADVFFIQPTTASMNNAWNAPYDDVGRLYYPMILDQITIFNGCCRIYAPHYRQATLYGLKHSPAANDLAYGDVARAFRWYVAHENHGRPFIIVGHSQGAFIAVRLLQEEVLSSPLKAQLVAAYTPGTYVPADMGEAGLPPCASPRQTSCIVEWNTAQAGTTGALMQVRKAPYWWRGRLRDSGDLAAVCSNPLSWTDAAVPASDNPGSLPFPAPPFPRHAAILQPLIPHLTGAGCKDGLLYVNLPKDAPEGFHDLLSTFYGSYHINDFGLFYAAVRQNASDRVAALAAAR